MRILIVDDEPVARRVLREGLEACDRVEVVGEAEDGLEMLACMEAQRPDVVFLDLQMPGMTGFEAIKQIGNAYIPVIIIVTAYDEFAIRAFEAGAMDYLLKPVRQTRLQQSIQRARRLLENPRALAEDAARIQNALPFPAPGGRAPKVVGKSGGEFFLLRANDVLAFQADGDLTWILTQKRKYLATQNLKALQTKLQPFGFRRIHRNALVNIDAIQKLSTITSQRWMVTLSNGQEFIVSKRQAKNIRDVLYL